MVSNCCNAETREGGIAGGTNWHECTKCGEPCDIKKQFTEEDMKSCLKHLDEFEEKESRPDGFYDELILHWQQSKVMRIEFDFDFWIDEFMNLNESMGDIKKQESLARHMAINKFMWLFAEEHGRGMWFIKYHDELGWYPELSDDSIEGIGFATQEIGEACLKQLQEWPKFNDLLTSTKR